MKSLVIIEHKNGVLHRMSREAISGAQKIGGEISALVIGKNSESVASELSNFQIEKTVIVDHELVPSYNVDGYKEIIKQVVDSISPNIIITGHTYQARDFMPRVSAALDIPFIPDIVELENSIYVKQVLNSKLNASISSSSDRVLISFQSASYSEEDIIKGSSRSESFDVDLDSSSIKSKSDDPFQESASEVDLESAELIVSVGRGIEKEENKSIAFDLAKVIGAEVSASRPVVDAGWLPSSRQVGSSGSTISPKLYLSLGVSGAIQHVVGMKGSKNILAINKDPDAPIFEIADYAVVGDLLEIVPKLITALQDS
ncbi:MAG: electron transfer flavoprotein subunit alpha/FixB family protein [Candidatus Marinimicrobia bacterium]|nr:electron transfer flavoprotein subunit alpha/FixB family protein [Candidatus Neomarinimicrobiota bacterium]